METEIHQRVILDQKNQHQEESKAIGITRHNNKDIKKEKQSNKMKTPCMKQNLTPLMQVFPHANAAQKLLPQNIME